MGIVYLLHLDSKVSGQSQHYLGYCADNNLNNRLASHRNGTGAKFIAEANRQQINWACVRTWKGDRKLERQLKNRKNAKFLCPQCNPEHWERNGNHK